MDVEHAGAGAGAVVGNRRDDFVAEIPEQRRIPERRPLDKVVQAGIETAAVVGVAAREEIQIGIDRQVVVVPRATGEDLEVGPVGPHADVASSAKLDLLPVGPGGLDEAVIADGNVEPPVDPHLDPV
ncbi:MAG: hypothetical protein H0U94_03580, partial [Acidobacteria bacterium]|nr:hypothetical protein [Acidobacteriota bacterium]